VASVIRRLRDCVHYLQPPLHGAVKLRTRVLSRLRTDFQFDADLGTLSRGLLTIPDDHVRRTRTCPHARGTAPPTDPLFDQFLKQARARRPAAVARRSISVPRRSISLSARAAWVFPGGCSCIAGTTEHERCAPPLAGSHVRLERTAAARGGVASRISSGACGRDWRSAVRRILWPSARHDPQGVSRTARTRCRGSQRCLYVCSSRFVSEGELTFVRRWVAALRQSGLESIRSCNILVRPHPDIALLASGTALRKHRWPASPELVARTARPFDDPHALVLTTPNDTPHGLFESIVHSDAVVGLNTTAEIEAGIVGDVPCLPSLRMDGRGGTDRAARSISLPSEGNTGDSLLPPHPRRARWFNWRARCRGPVDSDAIRRFIESFVRPHGFDRPVAPLYAEALENGRGRGHRIGDPGQRHTRWTGVAGRTSTRLHRARNRPVLPLGERHNRAARCTCRPVSNHRGARRRRSARCGNCAVDR
jgi:hypothetical protein